MIRLVSCWIRGQCSSLALQMFYTYALPIKVTSGFEKEVWIVGMGWLEKAEMIHSVFSATPLESDPLGFLQ